MRDFLSYPGRKREASEAPEALETFVLNAAS